MTLNFDEIEIGTRVVVFEFVDEDNVEHVDTGVVVAKDQRYIEIDSEFHKGTAQYRRGYCQFHKEFTNAQR